MKSKIKISRRDWLIGFAVLFAILLLIDWVMDWNAFGTAIRLVGARIVYAVQTLGRTLEVLAQLILRRRAWGITSIFTSVGLEYIGRFFLSEAHYAKLHALLKKVRLIAERLGKWWQKLSILEKILVATAFVVFQFVAMPAIAEYFVLLPVGFLVTPFVIVMQRIYSMMGDMLIGRLYRRYCGHYHRAVVAWIERFEIGRRISDGKRLLRLQNLTGWRLWRYDPRYQKDGKRRRRSLLEPVRLWRRGELNRYRDRPLLSGGKRKKGKKN